MKYLRQTPSSFMSKVDCSAGLNGCWIWKGSKSTDGYGQVNFNYKNMRSHRLAYLFFCGEIPTGMFVCHRCDNPICCNPRHLFLGTALDNARDKVNKGRQPRGEKVSEQVRRTTPRGSKRKTAVINEEIAVKIREMRSNGARECDVARAFGVNRYIVKNIMSGRTWGHAR